MTNSCAPNVQTGLSFRCYFAESDTEPGLFPFTLGFA